MITLIEISLVNKKVIKQPKPACLSDNLHKINYMNKQMAMRSLNRANKDT